MRGLFSHGNGVSFSKAGFMSNPTIYITEMLIGVGYIIVAIWARRADKKGLTKVRTGGLDQVLGGRGVL